MDLLVSLWKSSSPVGPSQALSCTRSGEDSEDWQSFHGASHGLPPFHSAVSVPSQLWASQKRACRASDAMMSPNCNYVLSRQRPRSDSTNSEYLEKSIFKTKILSPTMGCYKWSFSFSCQLWKSSKVRAPSQTKGAIPHVSFINVTGCPFLGGRESHTF